MDSLVRTLRALAKARFRLLGHATLVDIPTEQFNHLVQRLIAEGWRPVSPYRGVDAWIDYGSIRLWKRMTIVHCEWDNWSEGSIEGPRAVIDALARETGLRVSHEWRWAHG
jgi:hypothetical protein